MYFEKKKKWTPNDHHLLFVFRGSIIVQFATHSIQFKEGECYAIEKESQLKEIRHDGGADYALYAFQFVGEEDVLNWPIIRYTPEKLRSALRQIEATYAKGQPLLFQKEVFDFIYLIHQQKDRRSRQCIHQMEHIREFIDQNFADALTLQQMADHFYMSPNHLNELFKERYGMTAMAYVTERRITMAKFLLARNVYRVRDISHKVGYDDEFYFSRKFKHETGMTPTQFARKAKHDPQYDVLPM